MIPFIQQITLSKIGKSTETDKKQAGSLHGLRTGEMRSDCLMDRVFFWGKDNVLELDSGNGCTTL